MPSSSACKQLIRNHRLTATRVLAQGPAAGRPCPQERADRQRDAAQNVPPARDTTAVSLVPAALARPAGAPRGGRQVGESGGGWSGANRTSRMGGKHNRARGLQLPALPAGLRSASSGAPTTRLCDFIITVFSSSAERLGHSDVFPGLMKKLINVTCKYKYKKIKSSIPFKDQSPWWTLEL